MNKKCFCLGREKEFAGNIPHRKMFHPTAFDSLSQGFGWAWGSGILPGDRGLSAMGFFAAFLLKLAIYFLVIAVIVSGVLR